MGPNRKIGRNSFIQSVLDAVDHFYRDVVQNLRNWQPSAPKLDGAKKDDTQKPDQPPVETIVSDPVAEIAESNDSSGNNESAVENNTDTVISEESPITPNSD